jgi:ribosomal silencing factor RsfS
VVQFAEYTSRLTISFSGSTGSSRLFTCSSLRCLCGRLPEDGRRKGGIKAFTQITLSERVPNFICLKAASTNSGKKLVFITNLMDLRAITICLLYKNRWVIEPLFKQVKQNFELTSFLSDGPEGIKTQIWVAMTLNLIFTVIHIMTKEAEDFATMVRIGRQEHGQLCRAGLVPATVIGTDQQHP